MHVDLVPSSGTSKLFVTRCVHLTFVYAASVYAGVLLCNPLARCSLPSLCPLAVLVVTSLKLALYIGCVCNQEGNHTPSTSQLQRRGATTAKEHTELEGSEQPKSVLQAKLRGSHCQF